MTTEDGSACSLVVDSSMSTPTRHSGSRVAAVRNPYSRLVVMDSRMCNCTSGSRFARPGMTTEDVSACSLVVVRR
jgi:hypothetical protein